MVRSMPPRLTAPGVTLTPPKPPVAPQPVHALDHQEDRERHDDEVDHRVDERRPRELDAVDPIRAVDRRSRRWHVELQTATFETTYPVMGMIKWQRIYGSMLATLSTAADYVWFLDIPQHQVMSGSIHGAVRSR